MKAGILKTPIKILRQHIDLTTFEKKVEYELFCSTRANVKYNSGNKVVQNDEIFYDTSRVFRIRYYIPVEETMRIVYDNRTYQIVKIDDDRDAQMKIIYGELVNE